MPRPELFSARWTVRLRVIESGEFVFSSLAKLGSRIIVDGATQVTSAPKVCSR